MTNNIAPIQKRVISALDILSVSSDTVVLLELFQKERIFWMIDMLAFVGAFPWPFLSVFFFCFIVCHKSRLEFLCKFSGKKRK